MSWSRREQKGMALVTVLAMLAILGLLTGVVGSQAAFSLNSNSQSNLRDVAQYISYGGLQRTLVHLRNNPSYPGGKGKAFPSEEGGTYDAKIFRNSDPLKPMKTSVGVEVPPLSMLVVCTGYFGNGSRSMAGVISTTTTGPGSGFAAMTRDTLHVDGGLVDAFTTTGSFKKTALTTVPMSAQIGSTNGTTKLEEKWDGTPALVDGTVASDIIDGDPSTPEPGVYTMDATATLGGETQLTAAAALDTIPPVTYLGGADLRASTSEVVNVNPGHYTSLHAEYDGEIVLEPGDYYFSENFELHDSAKVTLNGPVKIFVDGFCVAGDTATLNSEADPRNCELYLTGDRPVFHWLPDSRNWTKAKPHKPGGTNRHGSTGHESEIWGLVRAPDSYFFCSGSIYGDIQARKLNIHGDPARTSGAVHYLSDLGAGAGAVVTLKPSDFKYDTTWIVH